MVTRTRHSISLYVHLVKDAFVSKVTIRRCTVFSETLVDVCQTVHLHICETVVLVVTALSITYLTVVFDLM
jgi:hypothetical protein